MPATSWKDIRRNKKAGTESLTENMKKTNFKLTNFLLKSRTKTYASGGGKVKPAFKDAEQLEYKEGDWFYRDVYYTGNGIFMGLETIYFKNKAIWAMSYYGDFKKMTEKEVDSVLRQALLANWKKARTWQKVEWKKENYKYVCEPDFKGSIKEMGGSERIFKNNKEVYRFFYAGGMLIK